MAVSADGIHALLRARYPAPAWAYFGEVRNGTGYTRVTRTADALAMSLYPSRGLDLHGFEIKVHRSDWLAELKNPEKAEEIARRCDFWWVVAPEGVVRQDEVPAGWGFLVAGKDLKQAKAAPRQEQPKAIDRAFLAAILRRAQQESPATAEIEVAVTKAREEEAESAQRRAESSQTYAQRELADLTARVQEFQRASGIDIAREWRLGDIGKAVAIITRDSPVGYLRATADRLQEAAAMMTRAADTLSGGDDGHPTVRS